MITFPYKTVVIIGFVAILVCRFELSVCFVLTRTFPLLPPQLFVVPWIVIVSLHVLFFLFRYKKEESSMPLLSRF